MRFGQFPRAFDVAAVEGEVGLEVVALQLLRHRLAVDAAEPIERLLDAVLQGQVVGHGQLVGVVERGFVAQHLHQALVLLAEPVVEDLAAARRPGGRAG